MQNRLRALQSAIRTGLPGTVRRSALPGAAGAAEAGTVPLRHGRRVRSGLLWPGSGRVRRVDDAVGRGRRPGCGGGRRTSGRRRPPDSGAPGTPRSVRGTVKSVMRTSRRCRSPVRRRTGPYSLSVPRRENSCWYAFRIHCIPLLAADPSREYSDRCFRMISVSDPRSGDSPHGTEGQAPVREIRGAPKFPDRELIRALSGNFGALHEGRLAPRKTGEAVLTSGHLEDRFPRGQPAEFGQPLVGFGRSGKNLLCSTDTDDG